MGRLSNLLAAPLFVKAKPCLKYKDTHYTGNKLE